MQYALQRHPGEYGPHRFEDVWRWAEWPDRASHGFGADIGIDLVARQTEAWGGGLCAIQTKFYDSGTIGKAAVDSFLSASGTNIFSDRILAVTSSLSEHARTVISKASPRCQVLHRSDLEGWPVNWAAYFDRPDGLTFKPERYEPHQYQTEAVERVLAGFDEHDRGKLILPCGTGKSVVAMWIAEQIAGPGGRVLYLVPSIALMGQTMREWARQRQPDIPHRYVGICSDTRAGRNHEDADMAELAMPVTTDPERIARELSRAHGDEMTVVFCTYQSLELVGDAQSRGALGFDLAIADEAHRTTGIQDQDRGSSFTLIHDDGTVMADRRLYMTATPRVYTQQAKAKAAAHARDLGVYSMDDADTYGPEFYRMGFGDAVEASHLTDYKVLVIAVAEGSTLPRYENLDVETGAGPNAITLKEAVKFAGCWDALADPTTRTADGRMTGLAHPALAAKRAIAFTNTIRASLRVQRYWNPIIDAVTPAAGPDDELLACEIRHVDGNKNALDRANTIAWLQDGEDGANCRIVTNAKCLTEGVDVPALDAVLFLEPKKSQIDVVQAVGRVMRRSPGKQYGYVVLPVVVPAGLGLADDEVLSGSDFKQVWQVLKALRSHDERLDVPINTVDLGGTLPLTILTGEGVCDLCGTAGCDGGAQCKAPPGTIRDHIALRLPFEVAIASKLVEVCGDRQYWDRWGKEVAAITDRIVARTLTILRLRPELAEAFDDFCAAMRGTIGAQLTRTALTRMLAQHIVTLPVFDALFAESGFADRNPISKALNELLDEFKAHEFHLREEARDLDRFYAGVRNRLAGATDSDARLRVMLEVYETFFAEAMPDEVSRLGIVYTPIELVDFILRSVSAVLNQEFGRGLTDEDVHVLDPFTGTGTFINRLLTQNGSDGQPLIADADLRRKFSGNASASGEIHASAEMHANEIVLLAYYLAAIKIEEGHKDRTGNYEPFEGIVLTDTFLIDDSDRLPDTGPMGRNSTRAKRQNRTPIQVIVGNPPWSAGQKSAGDDNPNISYPHVEERVRATYGKRLKEISDRPLGGTASGNLYVEAFRWASDRLDRPDKNPRRPGVVAFVHPNSLATATSLAGMRAALRDEFTGIYVVNLRGDAYKSGDEFRREGDKIFGGGSRNGVQITVLVRNPAENASEPAILRYAEVPEYSSLKEKFAWLDRLVDVTSNEFATVPVNDRHDWVNLTDGTFEQLMPICDTNLSKREVAVTTHASGVKTNCDAYVYSFSRCELTLRIKRLIHAYNDAVELMADGFSLAEVTENSGLIHIRWTETLKQSLKRGEYMVFDESLIREVLYRPFTKLWLYEDPRILSRVKTISAMFPRDEVIASTPPRLLIPTQNNRDTCSILATASLADLNILGANQGGARALPRRKRS